MAAETRLFLVAILLCYAYAEEVFIWSGNVTRNIPNSLVLNSVLAAEALNTVLPWDRYTFFAPTNLAFTAAAANLRLVSTELVSHEKLPTILRDHIVSEKLENKDLIEGTVLKTLSGNSLNVSRSSKQVVLTGLKNSVAVVTSDINVKNGVLHMVDGFLFSDEANNGEAEGGHLRLGKTLGTQDSSSTAGENGSPAASPSSFLAGAATAVLLLLGALI
uniref:FAS1 domain-containing protein n=1 Tax=Tetraselmis sp. GSL018 TaxID=582737 RepID=A0A061RCR0_9CHLO|eukprot:CAMPEP_0177592234 /NCGR_PEP_ID=MMETSP0419_2-20121207/8448_1 /TAXON_ID=582737 /ORGANISM="Tetraselmis sp., Strain GSL018" /LENGTH=217 /DNA_ID=CAMNT_0019083081 /DNA_START=161 /DNA_END=814 /DNA_ORIENTATION=+